MPGPQPRQSLQLSLGQLAAALDARLVGGLPTQVVGGVCTDTRFVQAEDLFVALVGDRFDGHRFGPAAAERGAGALLVERRWAKSPEAAAVGSIPLLVVPDSRAALGAIGRWHRERLPARVVAVTGSNGKTTTKELLAAALGAFGPTHRTLGNFNNDIGLPLSLLGLTAGHDYAVIELGTSAPGEIAYLATLARPEVGVLTCVAAAHTAGLGDIDGVARAKGELFEALPAAGVAVVNADDPRVVAQARRTSARRVLFGVAPVADVRILSAHASTGPGLGAGGTLLVDGERLAVQTRLLGAHNLHNAAAALAAVVALGLDVQRAAAALAHAPAPPHRMALGTVADLLVLDDAYNANPHSVLAALDALGALADTRSGRAQAAVVLGDMLELGERSAAEHRRVGRRVAQLGFGLLVAMGPRAAHAASAASAAGAPDVRLARDPREAAEHVHRWARPGAHVLLKGSRGAAVERVIPLLRGLREGT